MHHFLKEKNINIDDFNILDFLTLTNETSLGALTYKPNNGSLIADNNFNDIDNIYHEYCNLIYENDFSKIDKLYNLSGSLGGSRPKAYVKLDNEEWIVKFPHKNDPVNLAQIEYEYMKCAEECGINIPPVRLIETEKNIYYVIKRFDRINNQRIYAISASSLLEKDFSAFLLDYYDLFKLTTILTKDNKYDLKQMYLLMCFNILSKNQDDHGKNFCFLYNSNIGTWSLAPAFDLTYSPTYYFEQSTLVNGKGRGITRQDLVKLGVQFSLSYQECNMLYDRVDHLVNENLKKFW